MRFARAFLAVAMIAAFLAAAPVVSARAIRPPKTSPVGYDISWPQCNGPYPSRTAVAIVGVNKGIVFTANPCLASEIAWAGGATAQLYANTGNPGPALSTHWPDGQAFPYACNPSRSTLISDRDTSACAFDYGYNAAADAYVDAATAFDQLALAPATPAGSTWWFDVETSNSWRSDVTLNVAALQGGIAYLRSAGVPDSRIGFYSTQYQWTIITGGPAGTFVPFRSWVAGASSVRGASASCVGSGFTGGGVALAQYPYGGFDADLPCA